jgi:hypothetical protein
LLSLQDLPPLDPMMTQTVALDPLELLADNERLSSEIAALRQSNAYINSTSWHMANGNFDDSVYPSSHGLQMTMQEAQPTVGYITTQTAAYNGYEVSFAPSYGSMSSPQLDPNAEALGYTYDHRVAQPQQMYWCQHNGNLGLCACCHDD